MTAEQIVASILALVAATISSGLTYVAIRMREGVRVTGVVVESSPTGGEDGGYAHKVRYEAGALGERVCQPLEIVRSVPSEAGPEVELVLDPKNPKLGNVR